jgi:hypothetical protein
VHDGHEGALVVGHLASRRQFAPWFVDVAVVERDHVTQQRRHSLAFCVFQRLSVAVKASMALV